MLSIIIRPFMAVPNSLPRSFCARMDKSVSLRRMRKNIMRSTRLKVTPMMVRGTLYCKSSSR